MILEKSWQEPLRIRQLLPGTSICVDCSIVTAMIFRSGEILGILFLHRSHESNYITVDLGILGLRHPKMRSPGAKRVSVRPKVVIERPVNLQFDQSGSSDVSIVKLNKTSFRLLHLRQHPSPLL
jgi:hypothetical protein